MYEDIIVSPYILIYSDRIKNPIEYKYMRKHQHQFLDKHTIIKCPPTPTKYAVKLIQQRGDIYNIIQISFL